jgi:hypothetical protein
MHMPNIATKSNTLLATPLLSKKNRSLLCFLVTSSLECERLEEFVLARFEERIPIFICLQSNEYKANVPPVINLCLYKLRIQALESIKRYIYFGCLATDSSTHHWKLELCPLHIFFFLVPRWFKISET